MWTRLLLAPMSEGLMNSYSQLRLPLPPECFSILAFSDLNLLFKVEYSVCNRFHRRIFGFWLRNRTRSFKHRDCALSLYQCHFRRAFNLQLRRIVHERRSCLDHVDSQNRNSRQYLLSVHCSSLHPLAILVKIINVREMKGLQNICS